ncbi:nitrate- and nitrite sensing domain-containing protein [Actinoplanes sp. NPDC049265]|uniref:sensor histidine kinase n=1 Tax=Actinoplanes sp. NPDC049265 TaxID=3363902 RepID=UPI003718E0EF
MSRGRWRAVVALLAVLWVAAAVPAVGAAVWVMSDRASADRLEPLLGRAVLALEAERRLSVAETARPGKSASPAGLAAQRTRTDQAGRLLREAGDGLLDRLRETGTTREADALVQRMSGLGAIRAAVDGARMDRHDVLAAYTRIIESTGDGRGALSRSRELLSEEDALLATVAGTARMADDDRARLAELAGARRTLLAGTGTTVPGESRLRTMEDTLILRPGAVPDGWSAAFNQVNSALWERETSAEQNRRLTGTPYAVALVTWAALIAGGGLIAFVAVLMLARRGSRREPGPAGVRTAPTAGESPPTGGLDALFRDLERRNQSLVHRLLRQLDGLARHETDDERLGDLFRADHLANRMRRNLEKAVMLGGDLPGRRWRRPVALADVVRAAASEVPEYERVSTSRIEPVHLAGEAVTGTMHLLAELIENATTFAPAQTRVRVSGERAPAGYEITIADVGPGMTDDDLATAHAVLTDPAPRPGGTWWGLYSAGRFADQLGIGIQLHNAPGGGLLASVTVPAELLAAEAVLDEPTGEMVTLS